MLLTGINYQNSLVYLLTFLLGALFYAGIIQTHSNLSGVDVSLSDLDEGYAGTPLTVVLRLKAKDGDDRPALEVSIGESRGTVHLQGGASKQVGLVYTPSQRGLHSIPRVRVETRYPMGMFRAWSYLWLRSEMVAYPRPVEPHRVVSSGDSGKEGFQQSRPAMTASDDLLLRPYKVGDSLQRVQWKRYAKAGQMITAEREPMSNDSHWLDYADFPGSDVELRLSYLAWLVEKAHEQGRVFGLRLPGVTLAPNGGEQHRRDALRRLALFDPRSPV